MAWTVAFALTGEHGGDQHGKEQSAEKSKGHGPRHGLEKTAFHTLQRENRQVRGNDDGDRVEHGPLDLVSGVSNALQRRFVSKFTMTHFADDVLHHDYGDIHNHSEPRA